MPSLLMETSFGVDDMAEVTTSFQSTTLERPSAAPRRGRSAMPGAVARRITNQQQSKRSRSASSDADRLDVEVVSKVREKILNSSSSNFLSNLIRSATESPAPAPRHDHNATWTIPRTHRVVAKTSLSFRKSSSSELADEAAPAFSAGRNVNGEDARRTAAAFDKITGRSSLWPRPSV